jgi:hypothetical protein
VRESMAKIFPFRRYNPTKCKKDVPEAPIRQQTMTEEDRAIMRGLMKEAELLALDKRAEKLPKPSLSIVPPTISIVHYKPEYIVAFQSLSRITKRVLLRKRDYKYMIEAIEWLEAFQRGAESYCAACGFDITAYEKDYVPYEIIIVERYPLIIEGLCKNCSDLHLGKKDFKIIVNLNLNLK